MTGIPLVEDARRQRIKTHRRGKVEAGNLLFAKLDALLCLLQDVVLLLPLAKCMLKRAREHLLHEELLDISTVKLDTFADRLKSADVYKV
jgi:hypothetical protein